MSTTTITDFETVVEAAAAAVAAGDYALARSKAVEARLLYMAVPGEMRGAAHQLKYRDLFSVLDDIDRVDAAVSRGADRRRLGRLGTDFKR